MLGAIFAIVVSTVDAELRPFVAGAAFTALVACAVTAPMATTTAADNAALRRICLDLSITDSLNMLI
jgi:hypothetical protein